MALSDTLSEIERELSAHLDPEMHCDLQLWIKQKLCSIVAMRLRLDTPPFRTLEGNQFHKAVSEGDWDRYATLTEQFNQDHDLEDHGLHETRQLRLARFFIDGKPKA